MATEYKHGDFTYDLDTLPVATVHAALKRTIAHMLSNEVASSVSEFKAKDRGGELGLPNDAEVATFKADALQAMHTRIMTGELRVSVRGPRGTALETIMRQFAEQRAKDIYAKNKVSLPTGDKTIPTKGADGTVHQLTRKDIVDRFLAMPDEVQSKHFGKTIRKLAEEEVAKRERAAAKAQASVDESGGLGGMLGL